MKDDKIWEKMYEAATAVQNGRKISDYIDAGGVAAAILSESGKIYTGVCVDTACTLGMRCLPRADGSADAERLRQNRNNARL